jgi:hypothetical protein
MIHAYDGRWCICTPTKCGTYSLEATLCDRAGVAWKESPRHDWVPGDEPHRILVIREPVDRWCSMYWFMRKEAGKGIWLEDFVGEIDDFVDEWARRCEESDDRYNIRMWHRDLTTYAGHFCPHKVFKMEDGYEALLDHLRKSYGLSIPNVSHRNATKVRKSSEATLQMMSERSREKVLNFCRRDSERWYTGV